MGLVAYIAEQAGATEPALKLILGQLAGYPILLLHRRLLRDKSALVQHLYFMLTGRALKHNRTAVLTCPLQVC